MSQRLSGKIALVTGGNSGIGLATAKRFAQEGAQVYITGRRQEALDAAIQQIGHGAVGVRGDVSRLADLDSLYEQVRREQGRLDVLFANAGYDEIAHFAEATETHFDGLFATNVKGLFFTVQKALPLLPNGAAVILNGSVVSVKGFEGMSVYNATKAAVRSFARTWTTELASRGIRVNVVSPGPIDTPGIDSGRWRAERPGIQGADGKFRTSWAGRDSGRDRKRRDLPSLERGELRGGRRVVSRTAGWPRSDVCVLSKFARLRVSPHLVGRRGEKGESAIYAATRSAYCNHWREYGHRL